jgi:hypothetical protein
MILVLGNSRRGRARARAASFVETSDRAAAVYERVPLFDRRDNEEREAR